MDNLIKLAKDTTTLNQLKSFIDKKMADKIVAKVLNKDDVSGYADASEIIKIAFNEVADLGKEKKKNIKINQAE